jgi:biopolymer transport protein ExbD
MALFRSHTKGHIVAEINITPLTDVFLVLLIIFMITTSAMMKPRTSSCRAAGKESRRRASW